MMMLQAILMARTHRYQKDMVYGKECNLYDYVLYVKMVRLDTERNWPMEIKGT